MNDLKPTAGSSSCLPSWSSRACIITVALLLLMAVLLLGQSSSRFRPSDLHTSGGSAPTMISSHLLLGAGHTSGQHPGFASHADDVTSQLWLEQGAAALPSTDDGRPTAVELPADAASHDPTLTDVHACTSCIKSLPDMADMTQDHRAVASHAATAIVTSPEEEPSASSNWLQSEALGPTSSAYGTSLEPSFVSCPRSDFSAADSPQDGASGHTTAPTAAATAVEPAPSDMVKPTFTKQAVSVIEEAQLVCTASPRYVTALQVAVLGELAMGGLICPATAVAPHKSDAAGAATLTHGQAKVHYSEDAGVQKPVAPLIAARNMLADIDPLAAPAEATAPAASSPPQSSDAVDADCTVHQCSSAASALALQQPAVAVHEPARLLLLQENQPGVISTLCKASLTTHRHQPLRQADPVFLRRPLQNQGSSSASLGQERSLT